MFNPRTKILTAADTQALVQFLALAGIGTFLPFVIHLQWITGPIVNAVLILVLFIAGIRSALFLSVIPSMMALSGGLLPVVLAPALPFIMMSNMILVLSIDWFYTNVKDDKKGYWLGVFVGAGAKFLFLLLTLNIVTRLIFKPELSAKAAQLFSWPQFATAATGGLIAWVILKWLKRL